jgi:hypothetical protein
MSKLTLVWLFADILNGMMAIPNLIALGLLSPVIFRSYLGAFVYRFNRRFHLETLPLHLLVAAATTKPCPAGWLRQAEESF